MKEGIRKRRSSRRPVFTRVHVSPSQPMERRDADGETVHAADTAGSAITFRGTRKQPCHRPGARRRAHHRAGLPGASNDGGPRLAAGALVQINSSPMQTSDLRMYLYHRAARTAFQIAGAVLSLRPSLPRLNCPLWTRRSSSMPAIVIAAVLNHLKPSIGPMRSFTPR